MGTICIYMNKAKLTLILLICCSDIFAYSIFSDTLVVPFEHKRSAIFHKSTLKALDSVVVILNSNPEITLSIEGYAYVEEGSDTICKYLSLNRALFVRDCMIGRGIDSNRISYIKAMGQWTPAKKGKYKINNDVHSRVELLLLYPPPPPVVIISDVDEDGIEDRKDGCPDKYGHSDNNGCPVKDALLIPFDNSQSYIASRVFPVLDKLLHELKQNPNYTIALSSHASKNEGIKSVTDRLSKERSDIICRYLVSKNFSSVRIDSIINHGSSRPLNAQKNPQDISENASVEIFVKKNIPQ